MEGGRSLRLISFICEKIVSLCVCVLCKSFLSFAIHSRARFTIIRFSSSIWLGFDCLFLVTSAYPIGIVECLLRLETEKGHGKFSRANRLPIGGRAEWKRANGNANKGSNEKELHKLVSTPPAHAHTQHYTYTIHNSCVQKLNH